MHIAYVNLFVSNMDRALEFYGEKLGLTIEFSDSEHGYASIKAGAIRLGLALPGPDDKGLVGRHTGIGLCVEDLVKEHARLVELGVVFTMEPTKQPWGGFMAIIADPDQNLLYLDEISAAHS